MAERVAVDPAVDELRRKARRRLVGAIVLALAAAVLLPMLLEKEPRPLGEDVAVRIPPVDDSKFVNRLSPGNGKDAAPASTAPTATPAPDKSATPGRANAAGPDAGTPDNATGIKSAPAAEPASAAAPPTANGPEPAGVGKSESMARADGAAAPETPPAPEANGKSGGTGKPDAAGKPDAGTRSSAVAPPTVTAKAEPRSTSDATREARIEPKADAPTKAPGGFVVQLAAFSDDKGANALASKLKRNGYPAFTEPLQTSRGTLYRVRVGGYGSREAAVEARNKLKGDGYAGIVAPAH